MEHSLFYFIQQAWPVVEPATQFIKGKHLNAMTTHLEAVTNGKIRNLLINIPPRHMKSLTVSVFWPVWEWIANPHRRWLFASYAASLSIRDTLRSRRLIESPWFKLYFGDRFSLTSDQNQKMRYENDKTGCRIATSVDGSATGEGGDRVVVDDPHNVAERESEAIRRATLTWWDETMSTRLNDPKTGAKIIVMQRVHEKDLSGHVLEQGGYVHLNLPAEFEPQRRCTTLIGWKDWRKAEGELLWPQRIGVSELSDFKLRLGPSGYAGQFQQRPTPAGGARFQQEWFRYYRLAPFTRPAYVLFAPDGSERTVSLASCSRFAVMDPAGSEPQQNSRPCYTVIQVWDVTPTHEMLLVHQYREQVQSPDAAAAAVRIAREFGVQFIGIEKDGIGLGIVQAVKRAGITVRPIKARGSKEARSETAEIRMAAGSIYFPREAPFLWDLEQELLHFPKGEYADQVDALAHAAMQVQQRSGYVSNDQAPTGPSPIPDLTEDDWLE
jgi:predicted phage terminase large subunit-like protein